MELSRQKEKQKHQQMNARKLKMKFQTLPNLSSIRWKSRAIFSLFLFYYQKYAKNYSYSINLYHIYLYYIFIIDGYGIGFYCFKRI